MQAEDPEEAAAEAGAQAAAAAQQQQQPLMFPCGGCKQYRPWNSLAVDPASGVEWHCAVCRGVGEVAAAVPFVPAQAPSLTLTFLIKYTAAV